MTNSSIFLDDLPHHIQEKIVSYLDYSSAGPLSLSSKYWRNMIMNSDKFSDFEDHSDLLPVSFFYQQVRRIYRGIQEVDDIDNLLTNFQLQPVQTQVEPGDSPPEQ